jgi:hypothetical protein
MRLLSLPVSAALAAALVAAPASAPAQPPGAAPARAGLMGDLMRDVAELEKKVLDLARAMPESTFGWRAGKARSTGEVLIHIAADNYFLPAAMGATPPASTGISGTDYKTVTAYEARKLSRDDTLKELEASFAFLRKAMADTPDAKLEGELNVFGRKLTHRSLWVSTTTHLHEHLGQLIAYARSNDVTPPWSK